MAYRTILSEIEGNALLITLNRPDKMNAMNELMLEEILGELQRANEDDNVRAIIFTGAGKAFCAGADMSEGANTFGAARMSEDAAAYAVGDERTRDGGGRLTLAIMNSLKPVIAAVNGAAVGIGVTMQLAMDYRIASTKARFGFVFARRGIVPEAASSWFLPRIVGLPQALDWCMSGRIFDADEARTGGLVKEVVEPDLLMARVAAIAEEIGSNTAPVSVALIRQMLWRLSASDHPMAAHRIDSIGVHSRGASADAAEGVKSFFEKRDAVFPDKVSRDMPPFYPWWAEPQFGLWHSIRQEKPWSTNG